ncbi:MAG: hypothetical protein ACLQB1_23015 [Streptosporangiaceae bacterium]
MGSSGWPDGLLARLGVGAPAARRRRIAVAALAGILLALRKAGLARSSASSTGLRSLPLSPWARLGVLTAWAAGALVAGGLVLRLRDG